MRNAERDVAVAMIQQERQRQIGAECYSIAHDDEHTEGQLADAAACYAAGKDLVADNREYNLDVAIWPWEESAEHAIAGKSRLRQLVIAGALILAEIERRLRAGEKV